MTSTPVSAFAVFRKSAAPDLCFLTLNSSLPSGVVSAQHRHPRPNLSHDQSILSHHGHHDRLRLFSSYCIFVQIIEECDSATLDKLCLLSSAVKIEVDKHRYQSVDVAISWKRDGEQHDTFTLPPTDPKRGSVIVRSTAFDIPVPRAPESKSDDETLPLTAGIDRAQEFAIRQARTVSIWSTDFMWDNICASKYGADYTSPFTMVTASRLHFYLFDINISGQDHNEWLPIKFPPTVRELLIHIVNESSLDGIEVTHSCTALTLLMEVGCGRRLVSYGVARAVLEAVKRR